MRASFFFPLALIGLLFPLCAVVHGSSGFCEDPTSSVSAIGAGNGTVTVISGETSLRDCEYWENCDGTFENAYGWRDQGVQDPYYGAFAEGFHGPAQVRGMRIYLTQQGAIGDETMDLFIWGSGIEEPGAVLQIIPHVAPDPDSIPIWPDVGGLDYEIEAAVGYDFYIGARGNFGGHVPWWVGADVEGRGGSPWTCIAPGIGLPTGWNHPSIAFGEPTQAMGFGVFVETSAGVDELPEEGIADKRTTWGQIKAIYKR